MISPNGHAKLKEVVQDLRQKLAILHVRALEGQRHHEEQKRAASLVQGAEL